MGDVHWLTNGVTQGPHESTGPQIILQKCVPAIICLKTL